MKFTKEVDGKVIEVEEENKNIFSLYERNGFKKVEDEEVKTKKSKKEE